MPLVMPKLQHPLPNGFVWRIDAAFGEQFLDIPEMKGRTEHSQIAWRMIAESDGV